MDIGAFGSTLMPTIIPGVQAQAYADQEYSPPPPPTTPPPQPMPPSIQAAAAQNAPPSYLDEPYDAPILAPDQGLMAEQASQDRMRLIIKYGVLGLLGAASGTLIAYKLGRSKIVGAGVGGLGAVAILLIADLIKMGMQVSEGLAPITAS